MRVKKIRISWFRGAADPIELSFNLKSLVLYGENGSGKSSFVDAVEHTINDGRIIHLAHEYSGKRQEKAVVNTHKPSNQNTEIFVTLEDNSSVETKILANGSFTVNPPESKISLWDYRCTILRQNEVADFIADTKGNKYSALLPLLGLSHLEIAAENLRKIERHLPIAGSLESKKAEVARIELIRKSVFGSISITEIVDELKNLYIGYSGKTITTETNGRLVADALGIIETKVSQFSSTQKIYSALLELSCLPLEININSIKENAIKLSESSEPLISERLAILKAAGLFSEKNAEDQINCPACGQKISSALFNSHIKAEEASLQEAVANYNAYKATVSVLCGNLESLKRIVCLEYLKNWRDEQDQEVFKFIDAINVDDIRHSFTSKIQKDIDEKIIPFIAVVKEEVKEALPDISELLVDKRKLETIKEISKASVYSREIKKTQDIIDFTNTIQKTYREQIRTQSSTIIESISSDIARMWAILHPEEKVEDVKLCLPDDVDKAIEISLKFYGIEQDSPRLTLSEGHRNSLGLCIFLAMAKREDTPIFLDDVVVSFDRNHRGRVASLLEKEFSNRQILLFTHERDWYIELKTQLDAKRWEFKTLMPWDGPDMGIRLASKQFAFEDARAQLDTSPDSAGNTTRKIMDVSLSFLAESLRIKLPYYHRERNDHRVSHDFLEAIAGVASSFEIKIDCKSYEQFNDAIGDIKTADKLLISWGNKASHEFDIAKGEAETLIDACERALLRFICVSCGKSVTTLTNDKSRYRQCECGNIRWKY